MVKHLDDRERARRDMVVARLSAIPKWEHLITQMGGKNTQICTRVDCHVTVFTSISV